MNIFLLNKAPTDFASLLEEARVNVLTTVSHLSLTETPSFSWTALEHMDGIILEISYPAEELHYILAQAIVLGRPTLCLYPKNREPQQVLSHLNKPGVPKSVQTKAYSSTTVREILGKFLSTIDRNVTLEDVPNIKFTLRLTPAIEHYLNWLARYKKINKADYIRKLLKDDADKNVDYQRLL